MKDDDYIDNVDIKAESVLKQLKVLNSSKSCGPDECADEISSH